MALVKITKGRDFSFRLDLQDEDGLPVDITGWTDIRLRMRGQSTTQELCAPLTAAVNEVQSIAVGSVPDSGDFKLTLGSLTTAAIAFSATNTDVENALNALKGVSGITVTGSPTSGPMVVTFAGGSGGRDQPLLVVTDNNLLNGAAAVALTPSVTTEGVAQEGIDVLEEKCGSLQVYGSEDISDALKKGTDLDAELIAKIGASDLNIPPLERFFSVEESSLA